MENVTPDLLKWQEGNMTATHVLCENASLDSPIYRVLTVGSERHCELHGYMMVDGVEEWNDERFIIPFTLGHVVGETYYSGTDDNTFKPVNRDCFVGRVYVGKAFV